MCHLRQPLSALGACFRRVLLHSALPLNCLSPFPMAKLCSGRAPEYLRLNSRVGASADLCEDRHCTASSPPLGPQLVGCSAVAGWKAAPGSPAARLWGRWVSPLAARHGSCAAPPHTRQALCVAPVLNSPSEESACPMQVIELVKHFVETRKPIAAICHGAQLLAAAGE